MGPREALHAALTLLVLASGRSEGEERLKWRAVPQDPLAVLSDPLMEKANKGLWGRFEPVRMISGLILLLSQSALEAQITEISGL